MLCGYSSPALSQSFCRKGSMEELAADTTLKTALRALQCSCRGGLSVSCSKAVAT